jgi:hypothetical protein
MIGKITALFACAAIVFAAVGCGSRDDDSVPREGRVPVDYDLTDTSRRSALMNYGILVEMLIDDTAAWAARNVSVRVEGTYFVYHNSQLDRERHMIRIPGPACQCPQEVELRWEGGLALPADGAAIEVAGVFGTYEESGFRGIPFVAVDTEQFFVL